jgi:ABC-type multidrug transport system ATPase subunit
MSSQILRVSRVTKRFKGKAAPALADVSFSVSAGEIIAVVGHNGAGKSTLFDIVGGLMKPSSGNAELSVRRSEIGWCPQREIVDWSLTVRQNIALGLMLRDPSHRREARNDITTVAESLGLAPYLDKTAETLSGGELRRTQIARAMSGRPQLMILDEPTTGLDPEGIEFVFASLEERRASGASALISTHETSRFSKHCTRVIAIDKGRLIADLPVDEFLNLTDRPSDDLWDAYILLKEGQR